MKKLAMIGCCMMLGASAFTQQESTRPNVLFIAVDDMADWCGYLGGNPDVITPNIDRLATRGIAFTQAFCTSPICGPSRASVLTGMRPETSGVYHNKGKWPDYVPNATSLPKHFINNGYYVMGAGKINHAFGRVVESDWHEYGPDAGHIGGPFNAEEMSIEGMDPTKYVKRFDVSIPSFTGALDDRPFNMYCTMDWCEMDIPDSEMPDGKVALYGVENLKKTHDKPFFLATGFYRPHQPFYVPKKYFDMYDLEKISLPKTIAGDLFDLPEVGKRFSQMPWTSGCHKTVMKHGQWKELVRGYLASITFADAQVGKLLDALDYGPHADNTWIILWSDHGWHLGQKEHWGKHTPWGEANRIPFIIVPPINAQPEGFKPGTKTAAMTTLIDMYPTLIEACGLTPNPVLDGKSLMPVIRNPQQEWVDSVTITINRGNHSVRTPEWNYIHYYDGTEELYDLTADRHEWFNKANDPALKPLKEKLQKQIPIDPKHKHYIRYGKWKCVVTADGQFLLFDQLAPAGISEHSDISADNQQVVAEIKAYLEENKITDRYLTIPSDQPTVSYWNNKEKK